MITNLLLIQTNCWFAGDVMLAMLVVKNKSISPRKDSIVLTPNMATLSSGCKVAKWQKDIAYLRVLCINIVELNIICCEPLKNHILEKKDTVMLVNALTVDTFINKCFSSPSTLLDLSCFR